MSHFSRATVLAAASAALALAAPQAASAAYGPHQQSFVGAATYGAANYNADPQGANNWACKPTAARPRPVVLVHGTTETKYMNWAYMSPKIKSLGLCVFAVQYGDTGGFGPAGDPIDESAKQLKVFIDKVLAATGAKQVDIVGHSQGGMMPRQYLKFEGGANPANPALNKVRSLVAIAPSNRGTTLNGIATLGKELGLLTGLRPIIGPANIDQTVGSPFLTKLNAGGMTVPGVIYTNIVTKYDEVITPYTNGYITDNRVGAKVFNIQLQGTCNTNFADHLSASYSARTLWYVVSALGYQTQRTPTCDVQLPIF